MKVEIAKDATMRPITEGVAPSCSANNGRRSIDEKIAAFERKLMDSTLIGTGWTLVI
jgi:hypothetical protein